MEARERQFPRSPHVQEMLDKVAIATQPRDDSWKLELEESRRKCDEALARADVSVDRLLRLAERFPR